MNNLPHYNNTTLQKYMNKSNLIATTQYVFTGKWFLKIHKYAAQEKQMFNNVKYEMENYKFNIFQLQNKRYKTINLPEGIQSTKTGGIQQSKRKWPCRPNFKKSIQSDKNRWNWAKWAFPLFSLLKTKDYF